MRIKRIARLEGENIILTPFEFSEDDIHQIVKWNNDQEILTNTGRGSNISTVSSTTEWIEKTSKDDNCRPFAIRLKIDKTLIGTCDITIVTGDPSNCTLGILIGNPNGRGKGYGTEAVKLLVNFAFNELRAHRVHLIANEENRQAIRCYEKAGFKHCGTEHEVQWSQGKWHNNYHMEIINNQRNKQEESK